MKKLHGIILIAVVLSSVVLSCADKARVIPVRKMEKIYREMFLADQWLEIHSEKRPIADTTWFYAPIFEKYGYDIEDYRASVDFYAFAANGNRGISCGLNNLQKMRDGEPLGGRTRPEDDFTGLDDEDDFLD